MTLLLELLISTVIVAVLFGVVGLLLPSSRSLTESVETNRRQSIVFDTINSLRRFKDWNPVVLRDPGAQLQLSGPDAGVGAKVDYTSKVESIGKGSWEIIESDQDERVLYKLENPQRGSDKRMEFTLTPTGRNNRNIEIKQDVLVTIAHYATLRVEGVAKMASIPADVGRLFRRESRQTGILLNLTDDNKVKFDIYVIMGPHVNIMETSKRLQTAVAEAIDTMVGISVEAVNVHVEDVVYAQEDSTD